MHNIENIFQQQQLEINAYISLGLFTLLTIGKTHPEARGESSSLAAWPV